MPGESELKFTRRQFVKMGASVAALMPCSNGWSATSEPNRDFEHGSPLTEFGYGDVFLAPCPQRVQLEQTHAVLMGLSEDSLLRPFRIAAGLSAPGYDLGGWYSAVPRSVAGGPPGPEANGPTGPEKFGQWLSALSRYFAATGDAATQLKVKSLVEGYAKTLKPDGQIFQFSMSPTYFYDKLICGLEDAYEFARVKSALSLISATTDAAKSFLHKSDTRRTSGSSTTRPWNYRMAC